MCSDSFAKEHHSTGSINSIGRMQRVLFGHVEVQFFMSTKFMLEILKWNESEVVVGVFYHPSEIAQSN
jgi:hypothetical protein